MQIYPLSTVRPQISKAPDALAYLACARLSSADAQTGMSARLASGLFDLDASRALYVYERRDSAQRAVTGVVATLDASSLATGEVTCAERLRPQDEEDLMRAAEAQATSMGAAQVQDEYVTLLHEQSFALEVILTAAKTATPLYALEDESGAKVSLWRVGRKDAIEALQAAFGSISCAVICDERSQLVAQAAELAAAAHGDAASPHSRFPVLLVAANQLETNDVPRIDAGLIARPLN